MRSEATWRWPLTSPSADRNPVCPRYCLSQIFFAPAILFSPRRQHYVSHVWRGHSCPRAPPLAASMPTKSEVSDVPGLRWRHPERSRFSGGARDLARSATAVHSTRSPALRACPERSLLPPPTLSSRPQRITRSPTRASSFSVARTVSFRLAALAAEVKQPSFSATRHEPSSHPTFPEAQQSSACHLLVCSTRPCSCRASTGPLTRPTLACWGGDPRSKQRDLLLRWGAPGLECKDGHR